MANFMDKLKDRFESSGFGEETLGEVDYDLLETTKERKRREKEARERQRELDREEAERLNAEKKQKKNQLPVEESEEVEEDYEGEYVDFDKPEVSVNTREFAFDVEEDELVEYEDGIDDPIHSSEIRQEEFIPEPGSTNDDDYEDEEELESDFEFEPEIKEEPEIEFLDESDYENLDIEDYDEADFTEQEEYYEEPVEVEPEPEVEEEPEFEPEIELEYYEEENAVEYDAENMSVYDSSAYDDGDDENEDFMEVPDKRVKESWLDKATGLLNKAKAGIAKKDKPEVAHKAVSRSERFQNSVFDVNDDEVDEVINEISTQSQKTHEDRINAAYDILEVLNIQETFSISQDYFIPADIDAVSKQGFSLESPLGFDRKEVQRFFNKTSQSIQYYTKLLEQRNRDVVTLSAEIDNRDDMLEKARYDQEIAQGISVMPTVDDTQTENDLFEARIEVQKLRKELSKAKKQLEAKPTGQQSLPDILSDDERQQHNALQDDYRKLLRERDAAVEEVRDLRIQIARYQEDEEPDYMTGFSEPEPSALPNLSEKKEENPTGLPDL